MVLALCGGCGGVVIGHPDENLDRVWELQPNEFVVNVTEQLFLPERHRTGQIFAIITSSSPGVRTHAIVDVTPQGFVIVKPGDGVSIGHKGITVKEKTIE